MATAIGLGEWALGRVFHRRQIPSRCWAGDMGHMDQVCASRWLSNVSAQAQRMSEFDFCEGIRSPRSHMAYFRAVQSR
jgi:hypothetical protein